MQTPIFAEGGLTHNPPNITRVPYANSLDPDEMLRNSASHPDRSNVKKLGILSCPEHISYITSDKNTKFGANVLLETAKCRAQNPGL